MTRFSCLIAGALLVASVGTPALAADAGLATATTPFDAHFDVAKAGLPLGTTHFTLSRADKPDCYIYSGSADPNALVRVFLGDIDERSDFCVVDGQIRPQSFRHHVADKPKKSYTLAFDWDAGQAHYRSEAGKEKTFAIEPGVQDPLSLQIAARAWVADALAGRPDGAAPGDHVFQLADDDGVEDFKLTSADGGTIDTGAGRYPTLRVARTGDHSHTLVLWLARNAHWIPVQVKTGNDGTTFTMTASQLTTGG